MRPDISLRTRALIGFVVSVLAIAIQMSGLMSQAVWQAVVVACVVVLVLLVAPPIVRHYFPRLSISVSAPPSWEARRRTEPIAASEGEKLIAVAPSDVDRPAVAGATASSSGEPTYKGMATAVYYLGELTKVQKEAEKYRDDDPVLGLSYQCPSCDYRTYTTQGAVAMLNHIEAKHGPTSDAPVEPHDGTSYRPDLDESPPERFEVELAAYCEDRRQLLNTGTELRAYLLAVNPNANQDGEWETRQLRPWIASFQRHEGKWPDQSRLGDLGPLPKMTPYWAAKDLRLVEPRLAWLRAHGTRCDE